MDFGRNTFVRFDLIIYCGGLQILKFKFALRILQRYNYFIYLFTV